MTRDLLSEVHSGILTTEETEEIVNNILASPDAARIVEQLMLTKKEYTAYMQGAPFDIIARWRYEKWPEQCARCHTPIDSDKYGWIVREDTQGRFALEHITCP